MVLSTLALAGGGALALPAAAHASIAPVQDLGYADGCTYAGQSYSEGAVVYMGPVSKTCTGGRWI